MCRQDPPTTVGMVAKKYAAVLVSRVRGLLRSRAAEPDPRSRAPDEQVDHAENLEWFGQNGPYTVLVADPPWPFADRLRQSKVKRGAEDNYPTLTIESIAALPVHSVMAESAMCCLWVPASLLADGLRVLKAWGFEHKQVWIWVKTAKKGGALEDGSPRLAFGMGRLARNASELILVGVRGNRPTDLYDQIEDHSIRNVFLAPQMPHSQKPEDTQDALEQMFPAGRKLEMFARRQRPAWTCIGNEAPATFGRDVRDSIRDLAGDLQTEADGRTT